MACTNPMLRVCTKEKEYTPYISNQTKYEAARSNHNARIYNLRKYLKGDAAKGESPKDRERNIITGLKAGTMTLIPCGKCSECQEAVKKRWSARVENEASYYPEDEKYFITLTYSPENVPVLEYQNTGEFYRGLRDENAKAFYGIGATEAETLYEPDVNKFIKRWRSDAIRKGYSSSEAGATKYFYCGEYGAGDARPHYHMIMLGIKIPDIEPANNHTTSQFKSKYLEEKWGLGYVMIEPVEQGTIDYVAGYVQKAGNYYDRQMQDGEHEAINYKEMFAAKGMKPEFRRASIGLGKKWAIDHADTLYMSKGGELANGREEPVIMYYDEIIDKIHCEREGKEYIPKKHSGIEEEYTSAQSDYMKEIKRRRKEGAVAQWDNYWWTGNLNYTDYLNTAATAKKNRKRVKGQINERDKL